jgi:GTP-binding protein
MKFVDQIKIIIASGKGGPGCVSFRRESKMPRGGPDGGDGGRGGHVYLKVSKNFNSLVDFRQNKKYSGKSGIQGGGANMSGADGEDLYLEVPRGTVVRKVGGEIIADMTDVDEFQVLKGGRGGKGNTHFKTSVNQAPDYAQPGEPGEEEEVFLELKLIADVGIVGFPNAGKSTLISRISAARPKIADYPFTTLTPNLGVVKVGDYQSFIVADIPGLIQGASQGIGLGIQFLQHVERTSLFLHLIDASPLSGRDPLNDYSDINKELNEYDRINEGKEGFFPLSNRKQYVVLNKIETLRADELAQLVRKFEKEIGSKPYTVSAVTGAGIKELVQEVGKSILKNEAEL